MSYKTVLAHINDERRAARLIEFAALFAKAHDAHLIGLFVVPLPVVLNEWPDIAIAEMIESQRKSYREEGGRIEAIFNEKTAFLPRPAEWRQLESQYATVAEALVQNARMADIVIAPQADLSWHLTHTLDGAEAAIMESGRPVLVVPNAGDHQPTPAHVTVAWNGRKEATRAAFDALPIIKKAGQAGIVWVDPRTGSPAAGDLPCAELAVTFARHGVKADAKAIQADDEGVAAALREEAKRNASGLLVMGAYGHSRLREFVLGGATRNTMREMTLPVLFSH
ncbi:MAG TPA: universal stress protein [Hyphomicrobium sp.]|nr:universal stress protein [Hyphomicrobium sp.]